MTDNVGQTASSARNGSTGGQDTAAGQDSGDSAGAGGYAAARLRLLQEEPRTGPPRRSALARLTDGWLAGLLAEGAARAGEPSWTRGSAGPDETSGGTSSAYGASAPSLPLRGVALVAVGGYGRGELSPRSDLDVLLLHDGTAEPSAVAALADSVWYPVWDLGLALDHSVRTPAEARRTAAEDLKVQLGLLDARHLAGDSSLTAGLRSSMLADWRNQAVKRLPELHELCQERAERHGELQFLLEPDLKEARGGLRDLTALRAVAASWLADAPREGLEQARNRLLDTRDALHLTTGRATDRLALQEQDQVAADLGLLDADVLLRQVYEAARTVAYAQDVTWREVGRVIRSRSARPRLRGLLGSGRSKGPGGRGRAPGSSGTERTPLAEGIVEQDGEVVLALSARPERDPVLPLRAAAAAAQAGLPLSRHAVRRMAASVHPLPVPWPAEATEQFVTLLGAGEPTVAVWEALEAEGLITQLLPDWERVRCRPQRNAVHRWTVDRHLVETAVQASALTRRVGRPDLLLVAALLHDIGKGWPGDHSVAGEVIARDVAARTGFDSADVDVLASLVRHHLLLVRTATRRDLDDPATVHSVAEAVRGTGTLELLHALTEADALATGPAAWSAWRGSLVTDLVKRVAAVLAGEQPEERAPDEPDAEQERLAVEAWRTGGPVLALHARPDPQPVTVEGGAVGGAGGAAAGQPSAPSAPEREPEGDGKAAKQGKQRKPKPGREAEPEQQPEPMGVELLIALPDQPGVLPAAAGVLALHRLTVRAADLRALELPEEVLTSEPRPSGGVPAGTGMLLLSWRVAAEYGSLPQAARLRNDLTRALDGTLDIPARLAEREAAYPRRRGVQAPPPRVTVAPAGSRRATVIEVRAQDAPGLLHRIGRALEDAKVRVRSAHISTLGANAVDAFYVTGPEGDPLPDALAADVVHIVENALR